MASRVCGDKPRRFQDVLTAGGNILRAKRDRRHAKWRRSRFICNQPVTASLGGRAGFRAAALGLLDAGRREHFNAFELGRIAGDLGFALGVDEVVFRRYFVARADELVALRAVAGVGVGAVLGFHLHSERKQIIRLIGDMRCRRAPADEAEEAVDLILGGYLVVADGKLLMDDILADLHLHV